MRARTTFLVVVVVLLCFSSANLCSARTVDFEDIDLAPESDIRVVTDDDGNVLPSGFISSGGVQLLNEHAPWGWSLGFLVSNRTDTATPGFDPTIGDFGAVVNDASAFSGSGVNGSSNYAVSFGYLDSLDPTNIQQLQLLPRLLVPADQQIVAAHFTNTTWAGLSMIQGDGFAKVFGGETGDDPDFFRLSVYGSSAGVPLSESVEMYLADFRFENPEDDFILNEWKRLDLSALSDADELYFNLDSSDVGDFGMNTPSFFAIDGIELRDAAALIGDFSGNGQIDNSDVDLVCSAISNGGADATFDLDANGMVGTGDVDTLLAAAGVVAGDTNFDGTVDFADFLVVSASFGNATTWSQGDFDCDGTTQFSDFLILSSNFGETMTQEALNVPEPGNAMMLFWLGLLGLRRRRFAG